jgi:type III pantothenate kinase
MLHGYSELVDGLLVRIEKEIGEPCEVALTGGLATLFHNRLRHSCLHLPDLTLDGIALLFKENT